MAWLLLFSAGFVEIIFALSLKYNQGFTKLWPSIVTAVIWYWQFWFVNVGTQNLANRNGVCCLDGYGSGWCGYIGHHFI